MHKNENYFPSVLILLFLLYPSQFISEMQKEYDYYFLKNQESWLHKRGRGVGEMIYQAHYNRKNVAVVSNFSYSIPCSVNLTAEIDAAEQSDRILKGPEIHPNSFEMEHGKKRT